MGDITEDRLAIRCPGVSIETLLAVFCALHHSGEHVLIFSDRIFCAFPINSSVVSSQIDRLTFISFVARRLGVFRQNFDILSSPR